MDRQFSAELRHYFAQVGGYPVRGRGWSVGQWRREPVRSVRLAELTATNHRRRLYPDRIRHHLDPHARAAHAWPVCVVATAGRLWLLEGHHRAAAAILRGETTIRAHVMTVEESR